MIKILFTSLSGFPKEETGGPNKVINLIANSLPKEKFYAEFVSKHGKYHFNEKDNNQINKRLDYFRELLFNKSKFYRHIFTSTFYLKNFFKSSIEKITSLINEIDFDILNSHDIRTIFNIQTDKKIILSIHSKGTIVSDMISLYGNRKNLCKLYFEFNEREKKALEKVNQIIFPSQAAKELYFYELSLNPEKFRTKVIYNGIDLKKISFHSVDEEFKKHFWFVSKKGLKILNVANHISVKNIDKILFVLREYRKINKEFIFINVGSGPMTKILEKLKNELGLAENVIFLPILKNEDVIKLMKSFDVYLSFSERVIFDMVILEALACGMKVIASDDGGNKEIIQDGRNGYLVDLNDLDKIISLLEKLDDFNVREEAKRTAEKFSVQNMVNEYIKVYEEAKN